MTSPMGQIYIGGLPLDVTESTIRDLFEPLGTILTVVIPPVKSRYQSDRSAFVHYPKMENAIRAIREMHGKVVIGEKPIICTHARRASSSRAKMTRRVLNGPLNSFDEIDRGSNAGTNGRYHDHYNYQSGVRRDEAEWRSNDEGRCTESRSYDDKIRNDNQSCNMDIDNLSEEVHRIHEEDRSREVGPINTRDTSNEKDQIQENYQPGIDRLNLEKYETQECKRIHGSNYEEHNGRTRKDSPNPNQDWLFERDQVHDEHRRLDDWNREANHHRENSWNRGSHEENCKDEQHKIPHIEDPRRYDVVSNCREDTRRYAVVSSREDAHRHDDTCRYDRREDTRQYDDNRREDSRRRDNGHREDVRRDNDPHRRRDDRRYNRRDYNQYRDETRQNAEVPNGGRHHYDNRHRSFTRDSPPRCGAENRSRDRLDNTRSTNGAVRNIERREIPNDTHRDFYDRSQRSVETRDEPRKNYSDRIENNYAVVAQPQSNFEATHDPVNLPSTGPDQEAVAQAMRVLVAAYGKEGASVVASAATSLQKVQQQPVSYENPTSRDSSNQAVRHSGSVPLDPRRRARNSAGMHDHRPTPYERSRR